MASAYLTLSAALVLAVKKYAVPKPVFASAQYDWSQESLQSVDLLEKKLHIAQAWNADRFFVAASQQKMAQEIIAANKFSFEAVGGKSGESVAFYFLEPLRPANLSPLKTVSDQN